MEGAELLDSLLAMKDADRENVEAYLESRGAWVTHGSIMSWTARNFQLSR